MQEVERLGEEEVRVDEHHFDLVQQAGLGDGVEDDAVTGDQRRREDGVLLLLSISCRTAETPAAPAAGGGTKIARVKSTSLDLFGMGKGWRF